MLRCARFFAFKPLHDALLAGQFSATTAALLGHADRSTEHAGWIGDRTHGHYNGRSMEMTQSDGYSEAYFVGGNGYEPMD